MGYTTAPVLKTGWATGPLPLQNGSFKRNALLIALYADRVAQRLRA